MKRNYCFSAMIGQEKVKKALLSVAVNPRIGGVLIRGEKGTGKTTAVRALASLLPEREYVSGCAFGCDPKGAFLCESCRERLSPDMPSESGVSQGSETILPVERKSAQVVELPVGATEDMVLGSIDIETALKTGRRKFEPGILARANRNILYVDEVNLLDDAIVDLLLDSAATGQVYVEREGISFSHPSQFILIGTMNPEEGELRPQLLDRFGLSVTVRGEGDVENRVRIMEEHLLFEQDPEVFHEKYRLEEERLRLRLQNAVELLPQVRYTPDQLVRIAKISLKLGVDGHRPDLVMLKTALTLAALEGRTDVSDDDVHQAALFVLPHRMRRGIFDEVSCEEDIAAALDEMKVR